MTLKKAFVGGRIFTIPESWDEDTVVKYWNRQKSGVINVCPICKQVDFDILTHFNKCK